MQLCSMYLSPLQTSVHQTSTTIELEILIGASSIISNDQACCSPTTALSPIQLSLAPCSPHGGAELDHNILRGSPDALSHRRRLECVHPAGASRCITIGYAEIGRLRANERTVTPGIPHEREFRLV